MTNTTQDAGAPAGILSHTWRAWRDTSTDGQPCVRVHADVTLADAGISLELQRHGSEEGDAQHTAGELVLDLVVRPPRDDRPHPERTASVDYVLEEASGQVTGVTILHQGNHLAALPVEAAA